MRRIHRDLKREKFVQALTTGDRPCFSEIWRLLLFAAMLGAKLGRRLPLGQSDAGKAMMGQYFSNCPAWPGLLYLLGLVETDSAELLHPSESAEDQLVKLFEEYANAGLDHMQQELRGKEPSQTRLVDMLNRTLAVAPKAGPVVAGIQV